jgi:hypothetical protein
MPLSAWSWCRTRIGSVDEFNAQYRDGVECGDTLSPDGAGLQSPPHPHQSPLAQEGGGQRADFSITADTSNKQLAFVEHVVR